MRSNYPDFNRPSFVVLPERKDEPMQKDVIVGKCYRTPFEPSGVVRVLGIDPPFGFHGASALVQFIGDHPKGYRSGEVGRYPVHELQGREVGDAAGQ